MNLPPLEPIHNINQHNLNLQKSNQNSVNCYFCHKKLPITSIFFEIYSFLDFKCKCGHVFCNQHRHAEIHNCSFDYHHQGQNVLKKNNETVVADKVKKI